MSYYRLIQVDFDGKTSASPVVAVATKKVGKLIVYPNTVRDILSLQLPNTVSLADKIDLVSMQGQIILSVQNSTQINVADLPLGIYFLRTQLGGQVYLQKVTKI